jgi:transcription elongation factor GreB
MSRGFVKEDDQEEVPMVPKRAFLPDGITNFVTPAGMHQLLEERQRLAGEKDNLDILNENERRLELNFINAKLHLLNARIAGAKIVEPGDQPGDEIRFGAFVILKTSESHPTMTIQIVGVDEADVAKGKISFISPLARLLINRKKGDKVVLKQAGKDVLYEVTGISYKI